MIKILLADDHAVIRAGLKIQIKNLIANSIVDEAPDGASALEKIMRNNYSLIILDINMPSTDPFDLVRNILATKPISKILMFSMNSEKIYAKTFLDLGALGYLNKEASTDEIEQAIKNVMSNQRYLSEYLKDEFVENTLKRNTNNYNPFELLSAREVEIARYLVKGESLLRIASFLHLHSSTVGTYKTRIFEKLNCRNIVEISELAKLHNFVIFYQ